MKDLFKKWYWVIIIGYFMAAGIVFYGLGENSIIAIHDNLDLFMPQYQMMKHTGTFFAQDVSVPFMGDISRDYLPSEWNLYTFLYMILPGYYAYVTGYFLKIMIAIVGFVLLFGSVCEEKFKNSGLIYLAGFAYGILNLFPNFGICFASIPWLVFILRKIVNKEPKAFLWYVCLFLYPLVSYFSYFGIFILGYMCLYFIYRCICCRKFSGRMLLAIIVLAIGFVLCEYRLFGQMLFSDIESIRGSMVIESLDAKGILVQVWNGIAFGDMHSQALQNRFVMPACLLFAVVQFLMYCKKGEVSKVFKDPFYGVLLFIVFNGTIYGLYSCEAVRHLVDILLPPLEGFQFSRTAFFNPFLWYVELLLAAVRICDMRIRDGKSKIGPVIAYGMIIISIFVTVFSGTRYNDFYHTCLSQYHQLRSGEKNNDFSFAEFYSKPLFKKAMEDVGYCGEWSAAYGFYPAVLQYNGVRTIDGYLGYYEQYYKDEFRKIIAPALEQVPESAAYFDNWGARCNLYSGTYPSNICSSRDYQITEEELYLNTDEFKKIGARYIFSRVKLVNAEEMGFELAGTYTDEQSPYTLYLYRTASWYQTKEHSDIPYAEREIPQYSKEDILDEIHVLNEVAEKAKQYKEQHSELSDEQIVEILGNEEIILQQYEKVMTSINVLDTACTMYNIAYYQDVANDFNADKMDEIYADYLDIGDEFFKQLRSVAQSPYAKTLCKVLPESYVESFLEYEDMTQEEKDRNVKEQSLTNEYTQCMQEESFFEYNGTVWSMELFEEEGDSLSEEDYFAVAAGLYSEKMKVVGDIFLQLVQIRNEKAIDEGYDNYAQYAYKTIYNRDYTIEDAENLLKQMRKKGLRYIWKIEELEQEAMPEREAVLDEDDIANFVKLQPYMSRIAPEMGTAMESIINLGLSDMKSNPKKGDSGFTTTLETFGDAFIFDCPFEQAIDLFTYVHEFGHYSSMYYATEDVMLSEDSNMDKDEIHSQGLEMLFTEYYDELYGKEIGDVLEYHAVNNIVKNIVDEAIVSEFEIYVYENPDETLEDYCKKYVDLYEDYGYELNILNETGGCDAWIFTSHIFQSPCYYLSYLTTGLTSLEIYNLSKENRQEAITKYMEITALPSYCSYKGLMEYVGLTDIFDRRNGADILRKTWKNLKNN